MPRKQFVADLQQAKEQPLPTGITDLHAGEDDGQIVFVYSNANTTRTRITALIPDVSEYPSNHAFILFCDDEAAKDTVDRLQRLSNTDGLSVSELLNLVALKFAKVSSATNPVEIPDASMSDADSPYEDEMDDASDEEFMAAITGLQSRSATTSSKVATKAEPASAWKDRVRADLKLVKAAGFRVNVIGNIFGGASCYLNIAIRIAKLGISEEAMRAWQLDPAEYLILSIYFPVGYKTNEQLKSTWSSPFEKRCTMRVFACPLSKPLAQDVIAAFQTEHLVEMATTEIDQKSSIRETFISRSLVALLQEHLIPIISVRTSTMDWHGAERYWKDRSAMQTSEDAPNPKSSRYTTAEPINNSLRAIVNSDHFAKHAKNQLSFPLLAMQFMLRHFVRCVEFCLVCHSKIEHGLEAIKPYVCDRPLCLFQYMTLGFGPSIEHEIQSQPYVVDLLISFCYVSASSQKLRDLPIGLALMVPDPAGVIKRESSSYPRYTYSNPSYPYRNEPPAPTMRATEIEVEYDARRGELKFPPQVDQCPVKKGGWVVLKGKSLHGQALYELHLKILDVAFFPIVVTDTPVRIDQATQSDKEIGLPVQVNQVVHSERKQMLPAPSAAPRWQRMTMLRYDQDFDQLDKQSQCMAICRLLDVLPPIQEMQAHLNSTGSSDIKKWTQRIPPAAFNLLRWIIASNRACIMQVDKMIPHTEEKSGLKQEHITGMDGYMQFRFAMGAPDKERRFLSEVKSTAKRLKLKHPTIFAWHGSPLCNWHMIIREGLHFNTIVNGRAYGNGVYHARDAITSMGYSSGHRVYDGASEQSWPNSMLKIRVALALNELVNAPAEYASSSPYYVVQHLDWIQTRYMLVRAEAVAAKPAPALKGVHPQDPEKTPTGIGPVSIQIPASAIKTGLGSKKHERKKQKGAHGNPVVVDASDDYTSEETDDEDRLLLESQESSKVDVPAKARQNPEDFVTGTVDWKTLPLLPMPVYATSATTKRIMTEIQSMQKLLSMPNEELGWHIDFEKIENVYQWIVELHSFHKFEVKGKRLPLADELKARNMKSVVLEVRFGAEFPFSPPYVRVVRPRFRTFAEGGGGHIVMGGAMCMELLTNSGWSSVNTIESVLLQVRLAIASEPFARLDVRNRGDYGAGEAADGFIRACRTHGWIEPPGFKELAYGMDRS